MKKILQFTFIVVLVFNSTSILAQNISNKGTEFWVGYGHHQFMENGTNTQNMVLYFSTEAQEATVTVTLDSSGPLPALWYRKTYVIPPFTVISSEIIPKGTINAVPSGTNPNFDARLYTDAPPAGTGGAGLFRKKGLKITSTVPIVAYAHIYGSTSSGATMLLPTNAWGYYYVSINSKQNYGSDCYSWMYIIASKDKTKVEIIPSTKSRAQNLTGLATATPKIIELQKGQIYQVIGANIASDANGNGGNSGVGLELSGSTVRVVQNDLGVCNPIAVFSGSSRTSNPISCGSGGGDNDNQQLFPYQAWGKKYLTAPFSGSGNVTSYGTSSYKIAVADATTIVRRNGTILTGLTNSHYFFESNTADYIEASKPIQVTQFMTGGGCLGAGGQGDPEMIILSPIEQSIKSIGFYKNDVQSITHNYVNIILPTLAIPSLRIDGSQIFSNNYIHPNRPGYSVVTKGWTGAALKGQCLVTCDSGVVATIYGLGSVESYGYNAGTNLNNLNAISDFYNTPDTSRNTIKNHPFGFTNAPMEIGALIRYKPTNIWWKLSTVGAVLTPNADVIQNNPIPVDSVLIAGAWSFRYRLPGSYTFSTAGTYYIPLQLTSNAFGTNDCRNIEDLSIEYIIKATPTIDFTYSVGACSSDSVQLTTPNATPEGYKVLKWKWTFPNGDTSIKQNPKYKFNTGSNSVKLEVVVEIGGLASVIKPVIVPGAVDVKFGASSYNICVGQSVTFTDTTSAVGINNWYWNFGDGGTGAIVNANSNANQTYTYNIVGTFTVKHTVTVPTATCPIDTLPRIINVAAKAFVDFSSTPNCLPANGLTTFTSTIPSGGPAITSYTWTFGDPGSGALNTATGITATHNYTADGTYPVKLAIISPTGCNGDSTKNVIFNRKPQITGTIAFPGILCDNTTAASLTLPTISNGVTGTALFRSFNGGIVDPSVNNYNPALAGYGVDTIYYKYTTTNSCVDSTKYPITVNARPRGNFTFVPNNTTCIPFSSPLNFTSNINVPNSSVQTYSWFFENPSTDVLKRSALQNPSYNYSDGSYTVLLSLTGANNCLFDTTATIAVSKAPIISPIIQAEVCETDAPFSLTIPTITGGLTGTGIFTSFKGACTTAGLYTPSIAKFGIDTIYYKFTTTAGCSDSVKLAFSIKARPRGNFTFTPNGCLDASGVVNFTNNITVPNSSVQTYAWEFESPSTAPANISSLSSASHTYNIGSYLVKLRTTGANSCVFDTMQNVTFGKKPAISPLVQAPVCDNATPFNLVAPSITNGVTGTGAFSSFKNAVTNATLGTYNPTLAGFGVDTIYYKYTTGIDCYDSVKLPITINARPRGNFSFLPNGCLDASGVVNFTNNITVPNSSVQTYAWEFESPSTAPANISSLSSASHTYNIGSYLVKLRTTGANSCVFDTMQNVTFGKKPAISPLVQAPVCDNATPFNLVAPSITNGVTGIGVFSSFKNAVTNTTLGTYNPTLAGFGVDTIYYKYTTGIDCYDSVKLPITINARPRGNFSFLPNGCLNAIGTVNFTSNINVPNSSVATYAWKFEDPSTLPSNIASTANSSHNYNDGTFTIRLTATGANSCSFDTLQTQIFSKQPAIAPLVLPIGLCNNNSSINISAPAITNGALGTGTFRSFKNAITPTGAYDPSIANFGIDTVYYTFTTGGGCKDSVKAPITINARPRGNFSFLPNGCLNAIGTVNFTSNINVPNSSVATYAWKFEDPSTLPSNIASTANASHNYNDGTFTIRLTATGANGCSFDTLQTQTFSKQPSIAPLVLPTGLCNNNSSINITAPAITNGALGTGTFRSFKNAITPTGAYDPSIANFGIDTVYYTFTTGGGCKDSVKAPITINARPRGNFSFLPNGCLGASGTVNFTSNINVPSSSVATYAWKFEDPSTLPSNIASTANASHNYNDGTFTIRLTATGANGCSFDTLQTQTFSKQPSITPLVVASYCENADTFRVNVPSILNGVVGAGVFTSFKNAIINPLLGTYRPSIAGAGVDTIYYTFTTLGGCFEIVKTPIIIHPKPTASVNAQANLCLDSTLSISNTSSVLSGTIAQWRWDLADGSLPVFSNGNSFTKNYTILGDKELKLVVVSDLGCNSDTAKAIVTIRPMPAAAFTVPAIVCMPNGIVNFTNTSSINPLGSMTYNWDFGDLGGSSPTNPNNSSLVNGSHIYPSITSYTVSLTATSFYGCQKTDTKIINPFVLKPDAFAKTLKDTLCQGGISNFIDSSWSTSGILQSWSWNFADGSPLNGLQNPAHTFLNPGNYRVTLVVTNTAGCVSDTFPKNVFVYLQPKIDAGPSFVIQQGQTVQFNPTANDSLTTTFRWTPATDLSKADTLRPWLVTATGSPSSVTTSKLYTLTATGLGSCVASDTLSVKILGSLIIPNAFSPNGDGINDTWDIPNLVDYPGATVQIFNRSGQLIFSSNGYNKPWDGRYAGTSLPIGVYYYIINPKNGIAVTSGSVTVLR